LIDLNHILLFIAIVSPLVLLGRFWRMRTGRQRGWKIAAAIVLAGACFAFALVPSIAGFVGGTLWSLLLLLPSLLERRIDGLLLEKRFGRARNFAIVRRIFHPWDDSPYRPSLLRCLELARDGRMNAAFDQLATERSDATSAGRFATALTFALTENWPGLAAWCRHDISVTADSAVRTLCLRAFGEIGALDELVWELAGHNRNSESRLTSNPQFTVDLVIVLAFCGCTGALVRLLERTPAKLARDDQQFWIASAELAEGKTSVAIQRLEKLRGETRDATLQRAIARHLGHAENLSAALLSAANRSLLMRLIAEMAGPPKSPASRNTRGAPAVWTLIVLNLAMFGVELILGGSTNGQTLHNLGALEPDSVIVKHEYWRLLTALFLHYGVLHILFNLYALYLLGPALERIIGSAKFALGYLIAGLGSSAGVVLLRVIGLTNAEQLVGASGCVMGVIGVSAGLLLRHRQTPLAGRRLRNIIVIVALQTAFDLSTPQVSLAAHLSGFITGVGVGTIFASTRRA
jgi:rhomboid protease GluP